MRRIISLSIVVFFISMMIYMLIVSIRKNEKEPPPKLKTEYYYPIPEDVNTDKLTLGQRHYYESLLNQ